MEPITEAIREEFELLDQRWRRLLEKESGEAAENGGGEGVSGRRSVLLLVRSASRVEQTFGGINGQLWDDPFEWTLPETLDTPEGLAGYLAEVRTTLDSGFARIISDGDLSKLIQTPWGEMTIARLLLKTLTEAGRLEALASGAGQ